MESPDGVIRVNHLSPRAADKGSMRIGGAMSLKASEIVTHRKSLDRPHEGCTVLQSLESMLSRAVCMCM
uniref:Uncharacterized protein n=1 Tax=Physcomitrium patens TaxID=3218 RepID=A0A2K1KLP7_PHYPA|nr:hypothetical protein PHYPA_005590 [Physcomitrium patens]